MTALETWTRDAGMIVKKSWNTCPPVLKIEILAECWELFLRKLYESKVNCRKVRVLNACIGILRLFAVAKETTFEEFELRKNSCS